MTRYLRRNKNGFTLLELIIALAILSLIIAATSSVFFFGERTFASGNDQFDVQSNARLVADYATRQVRFATSLEILDFPPDPGDFVAPNSYIYVLNGALYHEEYDPVNNNWSTRVFQGLVSDAGDVFFFVAPTVLGIEITSSDAETYTYSTEVNLPNFQLDFYQTTLNNNGGLALAYEKDYTIPVNDPDTVIPQLSGISYKLDSVIVSVPGFVSNVYSYAVTLTDDTTTPVVSATPKDDAIITSIEQAVGVPGTSTIIVRSADGSLVNNYTVSFAVSGADASLASLTVSGVNVPIAAGSTTYNVELPYGTTGNPSFTAIPTDSDATVSGGTYGANTFSFTITAANGTTQETYTVDYTVGTQALTAAVNSSSGGKDLIIDFNKTIIAVLAKPSGTRNSSLPTTTLTVDYSSASTSFPNGDHSIEVRDIDNQDWDVIFTLNNNKWTFKSVTIIIP